MHQNKYNPRYDMYNTYKMREFSFGYYAMADSRRRLVMEMADSGFFYCGNGVNDKAACFSCGGVIEDWEIYDDPWVQHALHFPQCFYLNAVKGKLFINNCLKQLPY